MMDANFENQNFVKIEYDDGAGVRRERFLIMNDVADLKSYFKKLRHGYKRKAAETGSPFDKNEFTIENLLRVKPINPGRIRKADKSLQNQKRLLSGDDPFGYAIGEEVYSETMLWENDLANICGDEFFTMVIDEAKRGRKQLRKNMKHMSAYSNWLIDQIVINGKYPE